MDFGIFNIMQQRDPGKTPKQVYDEAVEQTMVAEELGYGKSWYAEHHFSNYSLCPSPLVMCAHMAGRTRRIRLGAAVVVAPLYAPARLLAEIGMVDLLSDGRLELGIGVGYQQYEFERFGVSLADVRERTSEVLDLIERGLTRPAFEFSGRYYRMPRSAISTRPLQKPLPPIWYAGMDRDHLERVARDGHTLFISGGLGGIERMKNMREQLEAAATRVGVAADAIKVGVARLAFVTRSRRDAERYLDAARYQQRIAVALRTRRATVVDDYVVQESPYDEEPSMDRIAQNLPVGDVDTVIERVVRTIREMRPVHFMLQTQVGDVEHRKSLECMELWMREVAPAVARELAIGPASA